VSSDEHKRWQRRVIVVTLVVGDSDVVVRVFVAKAVVC
jgi:hypothetical protein